MFEKSLKSNSYELTDSKRHGVDSVNTDFELSFPVTREVNHTISPSSFLPPEYESTIDDILHADAEENAKRILRVGEQNPGLTSLTKLDVDISNIALTTTPQHTPPAPPAAPKATIEGPLSNSPSTTNSRIDLQFSPKILEEKRQQRKRAQRGGFWSGLKKMFGG